MTQYYYKMALFATNTPFLIALSIALIFVLDRRIIINTLLFSITAIFINQYIKSIWQIPLDPSIGKEGWAFPSGHTQLNIVFWLTLLWQVRNIWLLCFIAVLLPSSYFAMVDAHFHNWEDIAGGIASGFAITLVFVAWHAYFNRRQDILAIICVTVCIVLFYVLSQLPFSSIWMWFYLGALLGIVGIVMLPQLNYTTSFNTQQRFILATAAVLMAISIDKIFYSTMSFWLFAKGFGIVVIAIVAVPYIGKLIISVKK